MTKKDWGYTEMSLNIVNFFSLSVKATNGSLDPGTELSKDEDIG